MSMASGFVPSQRGKERRSILVDSLGACEVSHELGGASPVPKQAPLPCLGGFASDSAEPQVIEPSQGKRKLEKAVGFQLSRRLPALRANGKAAFAFRRHSLPVGSSADVCGGLGLATPWGWAFFGFAERKWFPPHPTLPCSLMRLQGGMRRGVDTGWATLPQA